MSASLDAIVIGAGANGLAAAATLARGGLRVQVLERNDTLAGQASLLEVAPGFRAAPLALDAGWTSPAVARELGIGTNGADRAVADVPFSVALGPNDLLTLPRDAARAADGIRKHSAADAARWPEFIERMRMLTDVLAALYALPAPDLDTASLRDAWPLLGVARRLRALGRGPMTDFLRMVPMSVEQLTEEWFEAAPLRAAIAASGVQTIRHGPRAGGTGFVLLHHQVGAAGGAMRGRGVWRTRPDGFAAAAETAARKSGVLLRTSAPVAHILVRDDAVAGVALASGEEIVAPRVLSTADAARTLLGMVDPVWLDPDLLLAVRNIRFRGCTAFVLYALDALPQLSRDANQNADVLRGTVSLTPDMDVLERAADQVKYGAVPQRPHIEISVPTLHWPEHAPAGKHVLVARVHYAPYRLRDGAWDDARTTALANLVTNAIEAAAPGFAAGVLHRQTLSPLAIEQRFGVTEGALTQGELGLDQILFMRPAPGLGRYATPIDGLYLAGAGTHPGPGIPGGPGLLAARRVLADRNRKA